MRNKIILAMAAAGIMCATSAFASDAGGGKINFTGSVINAPCSVSTASQNIQVDLGQVSSKRLKDPESTSDLTPVTITLTGCSFETAPTPAPTDGSTGNLSKVVVSFPNAPAPDTADGSLDKGEIKNMATVGGATNVAIQLLHSDQVTSVDLTANADKDSTNNMMLDPGTNNMNFYARMISVKGGATVGDVSANITYKLSYF